MTTAATGPLPTDVIIVGSGPTGAITALLLARHGVRVTLISRSTWSADSPRAHITNQRTMEVLRAVGLEERCRAQAAPIEAMANQVLCTSLAGEEFGRVWSWGNDPGRMGEYLIASPGVGCDLPQDRLEPILIGEAARLGVRIRFQTTFLGLTQDDDGVSVEVLDQVTGRTETLRASYVVGADGGQSPVAAAVGVTFTGKAGVGNAMNVRFTADLSGLVAHRPGSLFEVIQPDRPDRLGHGMIRMVNPWHDWIAGFVHLGEANAKLTAEEALVEVRRLIGDDSIDVTITGLFPWRVNHVVADTYAAGRVLLAGDAVHRHPPMNGLGANTCIQDGFNLAWKLAYVLQGKAGPGLLDSYTAERRPVGEQIVDRAISSWHQGRDLLPALGLDPTAPVAEREAAYALLSAPSAEGEKRRDALAAVLADKAYIFEAHGVEMNQRYASRAIAGEGTPFTFERDAELYAQQTSTPGARLPHCWVGSARRTVSTLDLTSPERFTLLTRTRGTAWAEAAGPVAQRLGIELATVRIGPGADVADLYGDFARLSEIEEDGCLLVRPDQHVAWRSRTLPDDPAHLLDHVLGQILDRPTR